MKYRLCHKIVTLLLCVINFIGTTVKVHVVDLEQDRVVPPVNVRPLLNSTVKDLYTLIHEVLNMYI